jgi:hypothetical protein
MDWKEGFTAFRKMAYMNAASSPAANTRKTCTQYFLLNLQTIDQKLAMCGLDSATSFEMTYLALLDDDNDDAFPAAKRARGAKTKKCDAVTKESLAEMCFDALEEAFPPVKDAHHMNPLLSWCPPSAALTNAFLGVCAMYEKSQRRLSAASSVVESAAAKRDESAAAALAMRERELTLREREVALKEKEVALAAAEATHKRKREADNEKVPKLEGY